MALQRAGSAPSLDLKGSFYGNKNTWLILPVDYTLMKAQYYYTLDLQVEIKLSFASNFSKKLLNKCRLKVTSTMFASER